MRISSVGAAAVVICLSSSFASAESKSRYSDQAVGIREEIIPKRPDPLLELFQGFQRDGPLRYDFELPTGMTISPYLVLYGLYRSGLHTIDNGTAPSAQWVQSMDLFANFSFSGTERVVFGVNPLDDQGMTTKYIFEPEKNRGWDDHVNDRITTLFFEGDLTEIIPKLDWEGRRPLDFGIVVGRQPVMVQDGFLIADILDAVALSRNTIPWFGSAYGRITALYALDEVHRTNNKEDPQAQLFALLSEWDMGHSKVNVDSTYVKSSDRGGDQANAAISVLRPIEVFDTYFETTFRVAKSVAIDETAQSTDGTLLYSSVSWAPPGTDNIAYVDLFWAVDQYAPAARMMGGPLGRTGLLFSGNGLAPGSPISNKAHDAYGGAVGYQILLPPRNRRHLIFEVGGKRDDSKGGFNAMGVGTRYSQAVGKHAFFNIDLFAVEQESRDNSYGLRTELGIRF
ncbi:MAG: hypothetical protein HYU36_14875 [Planctomycetes bacterium]|nr:hypothetical protein [Planctomycetota bacterium]